jgi:hypothetical protein
MKQFLKNYSYDMIKTFLNQFAVAIFGFSLVLTAGLAKNDMLRNVSSAAAILLYLFLLYTNAWGIGYRDKVSVESGRKQGSGATGALIALCANAFNFLFAILITLASLLDVAVINSIGGIASFLALFLEGMYTGLLTNSIGGAALNSYWFTYFLITLPAVITCGVAYLAGLHDKKMTTLFNPLYPESDRDPSAKRKK